MRIQITAVGNGFIIEQGPNDGCSGRINMLQDMRVVQCEKSDHEMIGAAVVDFIRDLEQQPKPYERSR